MVGYGKDSSEKRLAAHVELAELFDATGKEVFIANAPGCRERRVFEMLLFDKPFVAIADRIGTHPVKNAAAAI
jgi:hypothetical protein